jgi:hypothetical protein
MTAIDVNGMPFAQAYRFSVPQRMTNEWDFQVSSTVNSALISGDVVLVTFYVRSMTASKCAVQFRFEQIVSPWTGSGDLGVRADSVWKKVMVPLSVVTPEGSAQYASGETAIRFRMGMLQQIVAIGGVSAERFSAGSLDSLQGVAAQGRDTTWRSAARARTEQKRKGDFVIRVIDKNGSPVAGAQVSAVMKRHAFDFATMLDDKVLYTGGDNDKYKEATIDLFNAVTRRICRAWNWDSPQNIQKVFQCIARADSHGLPSRGHTVIYPSWWSSPSWLEGLQNDPQKLLDTTSAHVIDCATQLEGRLTDWDVVNEMTLWTHFITAAGGQEHYAT